MIPQRSVRLDQDHAVKEAVSFFVKHYSENFDLSLFVERVGVPFAKVDEGFKCIYGVGALTWLFIFRTIMAAEIMAHAPDTAPEILAKSVGFIHVSQLEKWFERLFGEAIKAFKSKAEQLIEWERANTRMPPRAISIVEIKSSRVGNALEKLLSSLREAHHYH